MSRPSSFNFPPARIATPDLSDLDPDDRDPIGLVWSVILYAQVVLALPEQREPLRDLGREYGARLFTGVVCATLGPLRQPAFEFNYSEAGVTEPILTVEAERRDISRGYVWIFTPRGRLLEHGPAIQPLRRLGQWEYRVQHPGHPSLERATVFTAAVGAPWVNA